MTENAIFIAVEGIDGAGTTTQCRRLVSWLEERGREVISTREPSDGPIGRLIRQVLRGEHGPVDRSAIALLFAADRLDHLEREIRPALTAGRDVVSDRYVMSSLAYQGLDDDLPWVEVLNQRADAPDLTLFVDVPVEIGLQRLIQRGDRPELFESRETLERVNEAYQRQVAEMSASANIVIIDGRPGPNEVAAAIQNAVSRRL